MNVRMSVARGVDGQLEPRRSVFGQGAGNALLNAIAFVGNFGTTLLLSRLLGAGGYGSYAFAFSLATLLSVPAQLGVTPLLVREVTVYRLSESWNLVGGILRRANEFVVVAAVVVGASAAVVFAFSSWPGGNLQRPSLVALPLVLFIAVTSVRQGVMQGLGHVVLGRTPETVVLPAAVLLSAGALALALGDRFSASWAVLATDAAGCVAVCLGITFLRRILPASARSSEPAFETRRWARAVVPLIVLSLVSSTGTQLPTVLLGSLSNARQVGIYNVAFRVAGVLPFLLIAMTPAMMPAIVELRTLERHDDLQRLMTRSARIILLLSLPIGLVAIVFATPLLRIFGSGFVGGETTLRILAVGQLVNIACGLSGTALIMTGSANAMTWTLAATTMLTLALAAILVPSLGASGAAIATAAGVISSNLIMSAVLWHRHRLYAPAVLLPLRRGRNRATG